MITIDDTIAAISTPLGEGGIGIVRLSGPDALTIAGRIFLSAKGKRLETAKSHTLTHGRIVDPSTGMTVDEVLVTVMRAPHTYTAEDVAEINCHGGVLPLRRVLELVLHHGARLAEPGEFTKRAFLNGRIDLSQAEAVIDLIRARTDESRDIALAQLSGGLSEEITAMRDAIVSLCAQIEAHIDFPEDEIEPASEELLVKEAGRIRQELSLLSRGFEEGRFFREGLRVAIVGRPNVGKSSLLNALLRRDRAIVTEIPGTTRDILEEYLNLKGLPVRIMDTAGIRETHEMAEQEGVIRSLKAIDDADLAVAVIDGSVPLHREDREVLEKIRNKKSIIAMNKSDLPVVIPDPETCLGDYSRNIVGISAKTGAGLGPLKDLIVNIALAGSRQSLSGGHYDESGGVIVTNVRHKAALDSAADALKRAADALRLHQPLEIAAIETRDALERLGEIVGAVTTEDILEKIFSEFCIGK